MKISKSKFKQIIREELNALKEFQQSNMPERPEEPEPTPADFLLEILARYFPEKADMLNLDRDVMLSPSEEKNIEGSLSSKKREELFDDLFMLHNMIV